MSRHHILPPIVYTPAPPKPKKTERRPTSALQKSGAAASGDVGETQETGEVFTSGTLAQAPVHPRGPFAPVESAERRIPSTTGKLSDGTLKELLLAQERDQQGTAVDGTPDAKP